MDKGVQGYGVAAYCRSGPTSVLNKKLYHRHYKHSLQERTAAAFVQSGMCRVQAGIADLRSTCSVSQPGCCHARGPNCFNCRWGFYCHCQRLLNQLNDQVLLALEQAEDGHT